MQPCLVLQHIAALWKMRLRKWRRKKAKGRKERAAAALPMSAAALSTRGLVAALAVNDVAVIVFVVGGFVVGFS